MELMDSYQFVRLDRQTVRLNIPLESLIYIKGGLIDEIKAKHRAMYITCKNSYSRTTLALVRLKTKKR